MDFNVKKLAADAGTFLSRAVQVPRWGFGGGRVGGARGAKEGTQQRPARGSALRTQSRRPHGRPAAAGGPGDGRGLVPLRAWLSFSVPLQPNRRSPGSEARWGRDREFPPAPGGHLELGLEPTHSTSCLSDPTTRVLV